MTDKEQGRSQGRIENKFFPPPNELRERLEASPERQVILDFLTEHCVDIDEFLLWSKGEGGLLSDLGILRHFIAGNIVIHPFSIENLTPNSYDVTLGRYYYLQEQKLAIEHQTVYEEPRHLFAPPPGHGLRREAVSIFNPWDPLNVDYTWRLREAVRAENWMAEHKISLEGIQPDDEIIMLDPHELILAHTQEFIGGRHTVSTTISARSSTGRNMLEICNDANHGDIGFVNRWTLEIRNKSDNFAIPLVVGERYAQISFAETEPSAQSYRGQYQKEQDLEKIISSWRPKIMLPKMSRRP